MVPPVISSGAAVPLQRDMASSGASVTDPPLTAELLLHCFPSKTQASAHEPSGNCASNTQQPTSADVQCGTRACMLNLDTHYMAKMLQCYNVVIAYGWPHFQGARVLLLSNLVFSEWDAIARYSLH